MSAAQDHASPSGGVSLPPSEETLQTSLDHGIWYALSLWPALHVAVSNAWGGPDSADKMDWFAGAVSDLFAARPDTDPDDLEAFLLQVMQDEFDVNVEDESEVEVVRTILRLKKKLSEGDVGEAKDLERRWRSRGKTRVQVHVEENVEEVDDSDGWEGLDDEDGDVEMRDGDDVPPLVEAKPKEKAQPQIDDDGFTKVVGKKRR